MSSNLTEEAKKLPVDERIALVEEIWDSIAEENGCFELTDTQKQELDRANSVSTRKSSSWQKLGRY